jgi:hypothetical protein
MLYGTPKQVADGRYYVKVTKDDEKSPVFLQLNNVTICNSPSESDTVFLEPSDVSKVVSVDSTNLEMAKERSVEWFTKELNHKTLEAAYQGSIGADGDLKTQKLSRGGAIITKAFSADKTQTDLDGITTGTKCNVIVEFSGLIFTKKSFSPMWKLVQVRVCPGPRKKYTDDYLFDDQEDDPDSDEDFA